ncbi:AAA family ATPase [Neorhizobium galegae]|uniref:AAA family ATPase n=1 Tax=Neorhizobium galegae TaxID=399 RepID=UPI00210319D1|nr:AAA family ATPase [Neorhizobium galegae]MCQ1773787.1 AAA family ATPase [Neorhizobium galegae]MCQ1800090.1 AAA family ATPase [Neorhizobium galegae]
MAWDNWIGTVLTNKEEILKRGYLVTTSVKIDTRRARLALNFSAPRFLAYCAAARFSRQHRGLLSQRSFLIVLRVPKTWEMGELVAMTKLVLKLNPEIVISQHPAKTKRGHEFDADDALRYSRIILFAQDGVELHPDVNIAKTAEIQISLNLPNHFRALSKLLGCGPLTDTDVEMLETLPAERFNAIFRVGQSASRALQRIPEPPTEQPKTVDAVIDPEKGFGEASRWARNLREDLADWRAGKIDWSEIDKGILIYGPSGTGKTIFATALAASLNVNLVATSVTRWQSSKDGHLGDLLRAMYATFTEAMEKAPSLLFLDEFDSIGSREKFPAQYENYLMQVVNGLLECLDGAKGREGVIVVGACNFPNKVDAALLRSGRLEKHVHFPLPDADGRMEIFESYLPHLAGDERLRQAAERLPGKSGADINQIVRGARRLARKGRRDVTVADIEFLIPTAQKMSDEELLRVAIHESGHVLVAGILDIGIVHSVEVYDYETSHPTQSQAHGLTTIEHHKRLVKPRATMLADIAMLLACQSAW